MKFNRLLIIDPDLKSKNLGHFYVYDITITNIFEINNIETSIYCSKLFSKSKSEYNIYNILIDYRSKYLKLFGFFLQQIQIFNLLRKKTKSKDLHIFFPNLDIKLFLPIIATFLFRPKTNNISFFYRYSKNCKTVFNIKFHYFYTILFKLNRLVGNKMKIFTDSDLLIEEADIFYHTKVFLLPIPHTIDNNSNNHNFSCINSIYLPGRLLKGKMFEYVLSEYLEFYEKLPILVIQKMFDFTNFHNQNLVSLEPKILCLREFLERNELIDQLKNSDIILLPYSGVGYKKQTSGFFTESVSLGKIVIVGNDTWMSRQLELNKASGISIDIKEKGSLLNALNIIQTNIFDFQKNAIDRAKVWVNINSPQNFYLEFNRFISHD